MRTFAARPALPPAVVVTLAEKTAEIVGHGTPKLRAETVYTSSRSTIWFSPVINLLRNLAGVGGRCMLCSGSESSDVEHFKPKADYPEEAMRWENYLWSCGICNRTKGNEFPPAGEHLINPLDENVWLFFFIDEFGLLTPLWRPELNDLDPRAKNTARVFGLGREDLQQTRQCRLRNLKRLITTAIGEHDRGEITQLGLRKLLEEWVREPYQPDVADFFLKGPGALEAPFADILQRAGQPFQ
jgi:hypothetical protein